MKKLITALTAVFAIVAFSGCSTPFVSSSSASKPNRVCVDKFIASFKTMKSNGVWECATPVLRSKWFINNSQKDPVTGKYEAWNSDKDIDLWLQQLSQGYQSLSDIQEFSADPLPIYDNNGNQVGYEYHIAVWPQFEDGTYSDTDVTFTIQVDLAGQIAALQ